MFQIRMLLLVQLRFEEHLCLHLSLDRQHIYKLEDLVQSSDFGKFRQYAYFIVSCYDYGLFLSAFHA